MKKRYILFLILATWGLSTQAQTVINTEDLRLENSNKNFVGLVNFNFGMNENKAGRFLKPNAKLRLEWIQQKSKLMLLGGYRLTRFVPINDPDSAPRNFNSQGFSHLRFNQDLNKKIVWEAFAQAQFDNVQEIDQRYLVGTGPRFELLKTDSASLYLGTLYMYEYEETSADIKVFNKHHRLSMYLNAGIQFNTSMGINNTSYFQPRPDVFSDFRIASVTQFFAQLNKHLSFNVNLDFVYDTRPPVTVPLRMYNFTAGLAWQL
ncbi:MAG: hypothetical protein Sapg2KO_32630 [Saprospiraceae bacterium]